MTKVDKNKMAYARTAVQKAVQKGKISKSSECSMCGKSDCKIHGHHEDYEKPLEVVWLCSSCHRKLHPPNMERFFLEGQYIFLPLIKKEPYETAGIFLENGLIDEHKINQSKKYKDVNWQKVLNTLTFREKTVIKLRYGFTDGRCYSLSEIAKIFNKTKQRIRQIEIKALERLKYRVAS